MRSSTWRYRGGWSLTRSAIFPGYFRIFVESALAGGLVLTTPARDAAALWTPVGPDGPGETPGEYRQELAVLTGRHLARFEALDEAFEQHHPVGIPHEHLAILAVRPDRQRMGIGTALLRARHAVLDDQRVPAYLEASGEHTRGIYLDHGYSDLASPIEVADSVRMYPMWREPHAGSRRRM